MDWKNDSDIADALFKAYPSVSPKAIPVPELIEKVAALPGFSGDKQPPSDTYTSLIQYRWMHLKGES
jgi:FeS assembly protein IscX